MIKNKEEGGILPQTERERLEGLYGPKTRSYAPINNKQKLEELEALFNKIRGEQNK